MTNPHAAFRAVIYDLDGTLVSSACEIATALELTFREVGRAPLALADVEKLIGRGVPSLVERSLAREATPHPPLADVIAAFERHYAATVGTQAPLFEGARESLEILEAAGIPRAVVTNKPRFFTLKLLERLGVASRFQAIVAGDDGLPKKPAPDMLHAAIRQLGAEVATTVMLGDSDHDIASARNAGCAVWCVPYGYNEGRPPESLKCDRLVRDLAEAARAIAGS